MKAWRYIDGRDLHAIPPLTLDKVNVWNTLEAGMKRRVKFRVRHGAKVRLIYEGIDSSIVRRWFRKGCISNRFLSERQMPITGDLL